MTDEERAREIVEGFVALWLWTPREIRETEPWLLEAIASALSAVRMKERERTELIALRYRDHCPNNDILGRGAAVYIAAAIRSPDERGG